MPSRKPRRAHRTSRFRVEQAHFGVSTRDRVGGAVVGLHVGDAHLEVERDHPPVLTLVEVGRTGVHLLGRASAVDVADGSLPFARDDAHRCTGCVAEPDTVAGPSGADPDRDRLEAASAAPHRQLVRLHEPADPVVEEARPPALVRVGERELVGRAPQVRVEHEGVGRVHHRRLGRAGEELHRVGGQPLVQLVAAGDEHGRRRIARPARSSRLLPERRDRAREAVDHHGVQTTDVDAELERRGGHHAGELAGEQLILDGAALLREVAAAVRPHPLAQRAGQAAPHIRRPRSRPHGGCVRTRAWCVRCR